MTFSVTVESSAPVDYHWRKDGEGIPGATDASYTIAQVTPGDAGDYDVIVSNVCDTIVSDTAVLTIKPNPSGDLDDDCDVDLDDAAIFIGCMSGPGVAAPPNCSLADSDTDGDVDLSDFSVFQAAFTGSGA